MSIFYYFLVTTDYWILKTDYDHYSLVYSCRPIDDEYIQGKHYYLYFVKSLNVYLNKFQKE